MSLRKYFLNVYHSFSTKMNLHLSIAEAIRVAALFPVCALVMITIGVIFGILGNVKQDFKTLLAAVVFILSGKQKSFNHFLNRLNNRLQSSTVKIDDAFEENS